MLKKTEYPGLAIVWRGDFLEGQFIELIGQLTIETEVKSPHQKDERIATIFASIRVSLTSDWVTLLAELNPYNIEKDGARTDWGERSLAQCYGEMFSIGDGYGKSINPWLRNKESKLKDLERLKAEAEVFLSENKEAIQLQALKRVQEAIDDSNRAFQAALCREVLFRPEWTDPAVLEGLKAEKALEEKLRMVQALTALSMKDAVRAEISNWEMPVSLRDRLEKEISSEQAYLPGLPDRADQTAWLKRRTFIQ